jgi:hypothetical protein
VRLKFPREEEPKKPDMESAQVLIFSVSFSRGVKQSEDTPVVFLSQVNIIVCIHALYPRTIAASPR